jgi:hypothetical protein
MRTDGYISLEEEGRARAARQGARFLAACHVQVLTASPEARWPSRRDERQAAEVQRVRLAVRFRHCFLRVSSHVLRLKSRTLDADCWAKAPTKTAVTVIGK